MTTTRAGHPDPGRPPLAAEATQAGTGPGPVSGDQLVAAGLTNENARRVVRCAIEAFAARGYHGTTTREIAVAAGISTGALYLHYRSKEELLFAICRIAHDSAREAIRTDPGGDPEPSARLTEVIYNLAHWHAEHRTIARVAQHELTALSPEHYDQVAGVRRETEEMVRTALTDGVDAGAFTVPDVATAALALCSACIDIARWFRPAGRLDADEIARRYAQLALQLVGVRDSAPDA